MDEREFLAERFDQHPSTRRASVSLDLTMLDN
jgi:hypothetical protein